MKTNDDLARELEALRLQMGEMERARAALALELAQMRAFVAKSGDAIASSNRDIAGNLLRSAGTAAALEQVTNVLLANAPEHVKQSAQVALSLAYEAMQEHGLPPEFLGSFEQASNARFPELKLRG